jgi:hypothetical protein
MLVKFKPKDDHVKIVPLIPVSAEAKEAIVKRSQVRLLPGTNEVTEDEWLVIKPYLKSAIAAGEVVVLEKEVPKTKRAPDGIAKNLKELPAGEAAALIDECVNPDTLTKWYEEESRDELRILIVEKMKELKMDIPKVSGKKLTEGTVEADGTNKSADDGAKK